LTKKLKRAKVVIEIAFAYKNAPHPIPFITCRTRITLTLSHRGEGEKKNNHMKSFSQQNRIFAQGQLPFQTDELSLFAKTFVVSLIITSIILSFPAFGHGASLNERIPLQATEKTASLDMNLINLIATSTTFTVRVSTNPNGQAINAVGALINFSTSSIKALNINFENSFCELFIFDTIDNENGQVNIMCGKPYPGVNTESTIAEITFQRLNTATSSIAFDSSLMVLANDGFGTDVLKTMNNLK